VGQALGVEVVATAEHDAPLGLHVIETNGARLTRLHVAMVALAKLTMARPITAMVALGGYVCASHVGEVSYFERWFAL
jgi:hypothetical protein